MLLLLLLEQVDDEVQASLQAVLVLLAQATVQLVQQLGLRCTSAP